MFTSGHLNKGGLYMKEIWNAIQAALTVIGAGIGWFLGGWDGFIYALFVFIIADYVTGVMCAILDKKLSSEVGFKGICKKILVLILVGIGNVIDVRLTGSPGVIRTAVIFFYVSNEGLSIIENSAHLGLPIPKKLKDILEQLHDKSEEDK